MLMFWHCNEKKIEDSKQTGKNLQEIDSRTFNQYTQLIHPQVSYKKTGISDSKSMAQ